MPSLCRLSGSRRKKLITHWESEFWLKTLKSADSFKCKIRWLHVPLTRSYSCSRSETVSECHLVLIADCLRLTRCVRALSWLSSLPNTVYIFKKCDKANPADHHFTFSRSSTVLLFYVLLFVISGEGWKITTWPTGGTFTVRLINLHC